jgi:hypothetical protein
LGVTVHQSPYIHAMSDDYEYFKNKRPDRVYLSRSLSQRQYRKNDAGEVEEFERPFRVVSKVIDCVESHQFFKEGKQVSLRITDGARQEIVAKFKRPTRVTTDEGQVSHCNTFTRQMQDASLILLL